MMSLAVEASLLKYNPERMPNPAMANTSSAAQQAIVRVGIPLAIPYPACQMMGNIFHILFNVLYYEYYTV